MSYAKIIGRNKEINILDRIYKSKKSELVADPQTMSIIFRSLSAHEFQKYPSSAIISDD